MRFIGRSNNYIIPAFLICLYFTLIALDIYTTWLGTPDLKNEQNFIIVLLHLNFTQIIILASIAATLISLGFLKSLSFIRNCKNGNLISGEGTLKNIFSHRGLTFSFLGIWIFTTHFITSVYLPICNYAIYLFTYGLKNRYSDFAVDFLLFRQKFEPHSFRYVLVLAILMGFLISWLHIKSKLRRVQAIIIA